MYKFYSFPRYVKNSHNFSLLLKGSDSEILKEK